MILSYKTDTSFITAKKSYSKAAAYLLETQFMYI